MLLLARHHSAYRPRSWEDNHKCLARSYGIIPTIERVESHRGSAAPGKVPRETEVEYCKSCCQGVIGYAIKVFFDHLIAVTAFVTLIAIGTLLY